MTRRAALALLLLLAPAPGAAARFDFDGLLDRTVAAYAKVDDFVCSFSTRERIRDEIIERKNVVFKFRKPASFYMKMTEGEDKDTELIYVEGRYDNNVEVHLGGFWGFFRIAVDPRGKLALKNHRHPVTDADMGHILDVILANYRRGRDDPQARITYEGIERLDAREAVHAKAVFPAGRGYYGGTVHVFIDRETLLPVRLTVYGWNDEFLEEYRYEKVRLNVGLTDRDFDIGNPEYRF